MGEIREHVQKRQSQLDEDWIPALAETFEAKLQLFPNIEITRCVCLGLGSLSEAMFRYIPRDDPIQQLRFLTILLELLGKQDSVEEVFFQEPDFNNAYLALLRSCGYTVVKTPFAFINSNMFVFAPCLDYNINARIFENGYPALYIGNLFEEMISKMRYEEFSGRDRSHVLPDEVMDRWMDATLAERMPMLKEGEGVYYFEIRWQRRIGKESTLSEEDRQMNGKFIRISRYETLLRTLLRQRSCKSGFKTG